MIHNSTIAASAAELTDEENKLGADFLRYSQEECLEYLVSKDIYIPDDLKENAGQFAQMIIRATVENPYRIFSYSYTESQTFADDISQAVLEDLGLSEAASSYVLTDSALNGSWSNSYLNYNCYSYVLGNTVEAHNPGYYSGQAFSITLGIATIASLVKDDLNSLGYSCVVVSSSQMSGSSSSQSLICVRKGSDDYHFMKFGSASWLHKPGRTNLLRYLYTPNNSRTWTNELEDAENVNWFSITGLHLQVVTPALTVEELQHILQLIQ